jgi:hypothetical protein
MRSLAKSALAALMVCGCSPRIIDAVAEDDLVDGGGDGASQPIVDSSSPADIVDAAPKLLLHRYSFFAGPVGQTAVSDTGTASGAPARIWNAQLGTDFLALPGGSQPNNSPAYVDLPNYLISRLNEVTVEAWVLWDGGGAAWQRIFDFGEDFSGADLDAAPRILQDPNDRSRDGRSYFYLTPMDLPSTGVTGVLRVAYLKPEDMVPRNSGVTTRESQVSATRALLAGAPHQIDVTVKDGVLSMYLDGVAVGTPQALNGTLADIFDVNCWLGRSQFPADPLFEGRFYDFRVYQVALAPGQIAANSAAGYAVLAVQ